MTQRRLPVDTGSPFWACEQLRDAWGRDSALPIIMDPMDRVLSTLMLTYRDVPHLSRKVFLRRVVTAVRNGVPIHAVSAVRAETRGLRGKEWTTQAQMDPVEAVVRDLADFNEERFAHWAQALIDHGTMSTEAAERIEGAFRVLYRLPTRVEYVLHPSGDAPTVGDVPYHGLRVPYPAKRRDFRVWETPATVALLIDAATPGSHVRGCRCTGTGMHRLTMRRKSLLDVMDKDLMPVFLAASTGVHPDVVEQMAENVQWAA